MKAKHLCRTKDSVGEILVEDIFDSKGNILMSRNATINEYAFYKLNMKEIKQVPIYPSIEEGSKTVSGYKQTVMEMKEIMTRLATGKSIPITRLDVISESLFIEVNENSQMIGHIERIRDKDEYIYNHSVNVAIYSVFIGNLLGLSKQEIKELSQAALLHDIGKTKVPKEILNKKGKLTEEEFEIVKRHSVEGYRMSKEILCLTEDVREGILNHHEREDGSGYPFATKGSKINLHGKIIAIADVYDALTSERVYKEKSTPFDAIEEFYRMGIHKFSKPILIIFFKNIVQFYVNSKVRLNNGKIGRIDFVHPKNITKPIINVDGYYLNLWKEDSVKIEEMVG